MKPGNRLSRRIAVVGPCASGKSTLVALLKENGHDAYVVAQEHSSVRDLWNRQQPDIVIALDVSLEVIRSRRSPEWLEAVYTRQHQRLDDAYTHADLIIDTGENSVDAVLSQVMSYLSDLT